jgi:hypothetical protein
MIKSTSLPTGTVIVKPQKRNGGGVAILLFLMFLTIGALAVGGVALFTPTRLAFAQEQALALVHGGIIEANESTYVDGCVAVGGSDELFAVTRTRRTVLFGDRTSLEIVFSGTPQPTNACP